MAAAPVPLLLTRDPVLAEHVQRLGAAVGAAPAVLTEAAAALRAWPTAPLVLVGSDLADDLAALGPARRAGVHLLCWSPPVDDLYRVALDLGAAAVLGVPDADARLGGLLGEPDEQQAPGVVVGVLAGSGGAGATTFAAALAQVAARRAPALLVDLDPLGPGADRVVGLDEAAGVRWEDLGRSSGRLGGRALRESVPRRDGLGVLTWGPSPCPGAAPAPGVLREVLAAARRGHGLVVVDLARDAVATGPATGPAPGAAVRDGAGDALARLDRLVVVARPGVGAAAAAVRRCAGAEDGLPAGVTPSLVVRGSTLDADRLARATGREVVAVLAEQRRLDEAVDLGLGPVRSRRCALARAARTTLAALTAGPVAGATGPGRPAAA